MITLACLKACSSEVLFLYYRSILIRFLVTGIKIFEPMKIFKYEIKKKIKKIGVFSFARFQAALGGLIGILCGILYSFGGLIIDATVTIGWINSTETPGLSYGTILAFGALIGMPILFSIAGFVIGIAEAILYNLSAKWFGGMNLDFELQDQQ